MAGKLVETIVMTHVQNNSEYNRVVGMERRNGF